MKHTESAKTLRSALLCRYAGHDIGIWVRSEPSSAKLQVMASNSEMNVTAEVPKDFSRSRRAFHNALEFLESEFAPLIAPPGFDFAAATAARFRLLWSIQP